MKNLLYSLEMSFILNGVYYPESDIFLGTYNSFDEALAAARNIEVQDPSLYECYIYTEDADTLEIIEDYRVF